jgi:hypothetical protein
MSFFVSSTGSGAAGGNLGGLLGADGKCAALASATGAAGTWRVYLSTSTENARDRIGAGPWYNALGQLVASDVDDLHTNKTRNPLDENGVAVPRTEHDIFTGSRSDGTLAGTSSTCLNWTSAAATDRGMVGHVDWQNYMNSAANWTGAHLSDGCSEALLNSSNGAGRIYCFRTD